MFVWEDGEGRDVCFRVTDIIKAWLKLSADMAHFRKRRVNIVLQPCESELIIYLNAYVTEQEETYIIQLLG